MKKNLSTKHARVIGAGKHYALRKVEMMTEEEKEGRNRPKGHSPPNSTPTQGTSYDEAVYNATIERIARELAQSSDKAFRDFLRKADLERLIRNQRTKPAGEPYT